MSKKVFVDSNVIISSLLSEKGASYFLLNKQGGKFTISNISQQELKEVADRLNINHNELQNLIKKRLKIVKLTQELANIKKEFGYYTNDPDDAHIIAGVFQAKARFLLTYNIRHFDKQKIKNDLGLIVLTPAQYLQYLRSLE